MSSHAKSTISDTSSVEISVIVPIFNEVENIAALLDRLLPVLAAHCSGYEIIFIDDGSKDDSLAKLHAIGAATPHLHVVSFSRNFGKEVAIAAGIDRARGAAAVILDADLQHPPEVIAEFITLWRQGYKNVYGVRADRKSDAPMRRYLTDKFYKIFGSFGETLLPAGAGDFRLLDRQALEALKQMPERARFTKGLYAWIGFKSIGVTFEVAERENGQSKFSYRKLTRFAFDGLTSFSTLPLKVWTYVGALVSLFAIGMATLVLLETLIYGNDVPGYATIVISIMFFSGVQIISLGILGEYIGRIFAEVKRRPLYLVAEEFSSDTLISTQIALDERRITHV